MLLPGLNLVHTLPGLACRAVWNEQFEFSVLEEKEINVKLMDEDVGSNDHLGNGTVSLAAVRQRGTDRQAVQLYSRKNHARGTLHVSLTFTQNVAHCGPGHKPKKAKKGVLRNVLEGVVAGVLEGALKG
ncbi:hypothetical protein QJQ45_005848 [Haematococcus lacustris]|nr:hypothetical protein QJQ45_005848 [Haematococcus lacustris]